MSEYPELWAITCEAFGLQLLTVLEAFRAASGMDQGSSLPMLMKIMGGADASIMRDPVNVEWAKRACAAARGLLDALTDYQ